MVVLSRAIYFDIIIHKILLFTVTHKIWWSSLKQCDVKVSVRHSSKSSINKASEIMLGSSSCDLFVNYKVVLTIVLVCRSIKNLLLLFLSVDSKCLLKNLSVTSLSK